jgi:hypothetical protein
MRFFWNGQLYWGGFVHLSHKRVVAGVFEDVGKRWNGVPRQILNAISSAQIQFPRRGLHNRTELIEAWVQGELVFFHVDETTGRFIVPTPLGMSQTLPADEVAQTAIEVEDWLESNIDTKSETPF